MFSVFQSYWTKTKNMEIFSQLIYLVHPIFSGGVASGLSAPLPTHTATYCILMHDATTKWKLCATKNSLNILSINWKLLHCDAWFTIKVENVRKYLQEKESLKNVLCPPQLIELQSMMHQKLEKVRKNFGDKNPNFFFINLL